MRTSTLLWFCALAAALAACGGGGAEVCQPGVSTMQFPSGCPGDAAPSGTVGVATLALTLLDPAGKPSNQVSLERPGSLLATIKDAKGAAAPNVTVSFATSDKTGSFVPASGTALTDSQGVARLSLPAGAQAGAFTVAANAVVGSALVKASVDYAVSFPLLTLEALVFTPATLSAGGNASVSVAVSSGSAPFTPPLAVSFSSPCIAAGKASMGPPVLTQNGVASTSYSDRGCGVPDLVTATVKLGDATTQRSGTLTVLPASVGSLKFVSAQDRNIALKGTGGFGRQEFSTLKFEVFDTTGNKLPGALVDFAFADSGGTQTIGGLSLNPAFATSAADGSVTTLVSGGSMPTSVRVVATLRDGAPRLSTLSNLLVVSTGVPDQRHFSLATQIGNCEGRDINQTCSILTATLGDHFGNPVPDGTAINFSSEGGVIDAACVTGALLDVPPILFPPPDAPPGQTTVAKVGPGSGSCSVLLRAASPRPANGRITVLAYALGEEDLFDTNGNNVYDNGDTHTDKSPDVARDDNEDGGWTPGEPCIGPNRNGSCTSAGDGQYNGVLRQPQQASPQALYVSAQLVQQFSGSQAVISFSTDKLICPATRTADVLVRVGDVNGNLMPAGTTIGFSTVAGVGALGINPSHVTVNNVVLGIAEPVLVPSYTVTVGCDIGQAGKLLVTVKTPAKVETLASLPIN